MNFHSPTALPVYRLAELRKIEATAAATSPQPPLMERAGLAAAQLARAIAGDRGRGVLVAAGPGNNGGDAFVVARHLEAWWFNVDVVFAGEESKLPPDARAALQAWRASGGTTLADIPSHRAFDLAVDGLFGIGLKRDLAGRHAVLVDALNNLTCPVLALDVPSGLDSETGRVCGHAVRAAHTVTFIGLKPGLLTLEGPDHCGEIHLRDIGIAPPDRREGFGELIGEDILRTTLTPRRANTHKGSYGSAGIIGGAPGMAGAAILAGRAALQLGAGRVYVGFVGNEPPAFDAHQPELMLRAAQELLALDHINAFAIGPGLGQSPAAQRLLADALKTGHPVLLDADALNLLATDSTLKQTVIDRSAPTLLTPHPAEAARLLASDTRTVQNDRIGAACEIAQTYRSRVVLKGAGSICAYPDGAWFVNTSGNPGMASAGMGDVLSGFIAALLAQGVPAERALLAGVHLHGAAGDAAAAEHGMVGLTASECIGAARRLLRS